MFDVCCEQIEFMYTKVESNSQIISKGRFWNEFMFLKICYHHSNEAIQNEVKYKINNLGESLLKYNGVK